MDTHDVPTTKNRKGVEGGSGDDIAGRAGASREAAQPPERADGAQGMELGDAIGAVDKRSWGSTGLAPASSPKRVNPAIRKSHFLKSTFTQEASFEMSGLTEGHVSTENILDGIFTR
jgi:hypothetical protein